MCDCLTGAYLLYITWADRQVLGSPFKVTVLPPSVVDTVAVSGASMNQMSRVGTDAGGGGGGGGLSSVDLSESSSRLLQTTQTTTSRSAAGCSSTVWLKNIR